VVTVQDNGIGIPSAALEQIFDMFCQVPTHEARATQGLGIGLSVVRTLVEMHGGSVRAFSEGPQKGSRFTT
jgi:signal transduction histidine kinase